MTVIPIEWQTYESEVLNSGRSPYPPATRFVILLDGSVAGTTFANTASIVDVLKTEVVQANGYQRQRLERLVENIAAGTFLVTRHGLANGDRVFLSGWLDTDVYVPPTGFSLGEAYYVVNSTADTFQLAATVSGSAITDATELPPGFTMAVPSGSYDTVNQRHQYRPPPTRFTVGGTGYSYGGAAMIAAAHPRGPLSLDLDLVDDASDTITLSSHGMKTGDRFFTTPESTTQISGGVFTETLYYVRAITADVVALYNTKANAIANTNRKPIIPSNYTVRWHFAEGQIAAIATFPTAITPTVPSEILIEPTFLST